MLGAVSGYRVSGVYWGVGRDCRYSGARRGIGGIKGHFKAPMGCWGHEGVSGV